MVVSPSPAGTCRTIRSEWKLPNNGVRLIQYDSGRRELLAKIARTSNRSKLGKLFAQCENPSRERQENFHECTATQQKSGT
jgi:hypothetical protein